MNARARVFVHVRIRELTLYGSFWLAHLNPAQPTLVGERNFRSRGRIVFRRERLVRKDELVSPAVDSASNTTFKVFPSSEVSMSCP